MTFSNSLRSPHEESLIPPPLRPIGVRVQSHGSNNSATDRERANLHRRFTTNTVPTLNSLAANTPLSPIGQQRRQAAESADVNPAHAYHHVQMLQKKKEQYEFLLQQQERFQSEMATLDVRAKTTEDELQRLQNELNQFTVAGHQSEPTTPPEYHQNGFTTRSNRLSLASLTSPPSVTSMAGPRANRSSSQAATSPFTASSSALPSMSVPGTRRNSDEDEEDPYEAEIKNVNTRRTPGLNRISMPVTNFDLRGLSDLPDVASVLGTGLNSILNDSDDEKHLPTHAHSKSIDSKSFLHMDHTSEQFPILVRRDGETQLQASGSSSTLGASQQSSDSSDGWPPFNRHRAGQQSLPMNTLRNPGPGEEKAVTSMSDIFDTPTKTAAKNRHSMEVKFSSPFGDSLPKPKRSSLLLTTPPNGLANGMPKLTSSFSTNDIPTVKNTSNGINTTSGTPLTHAEAHLQNHNATIGRIPTTASNRRSRDFSGVDIPTTASNRRSRDFSGVDIAAPATNRRSGNFSGVDISAPATNRRSRDFSGVEISAPAINRRSRDFSGMEIHTEEANIPPLPSMLQGSAPPFGPAVSVPTTAGTPTPLLAQAHTLPSPYSPQGFYGGYGMSMFGNGMNNMSMPGQQGSWAAQTPVQPHYSPYYNQFPRYNAPNPLAMDSQSRVIRERRQVNAEENARFNNYKITEVQGRIAELCKDQHGCRFLQREVEKREPETIELVFHETKDHFVELMTDPFGNYLCQKLLEYTNVAQRTELIHIAASDLVRIALNQHGTRALQKMIEFITTPEQIDIIIAAFGGQVVTLIQDLNGNHVIQKCLNHLTPEQAQFIFDAVGHHCLIVGTHRHGCCVLQRCIDHATGKQQEDLVHCITQNAYTLVQDPFGNYVVQYILDLNETKYTRTLCLQFCGKVQILSKQKFSSNVIEKCIRCADPETRRLLATELILPPNEMEKVLRDNYANYVVQTALDHADRDVQDQFWEAIMPLLPILKSTPCGRRLQTKLAQRDAKENTQTAGQITPPEGPVFYNPNPQRLSGGSFPGYNVPATTYNPYMNFTSIASPTPHRLSNPGLPLHLQNTVATPFSPVGYPFAATPSHIGNRF